MHTFVIEITCECVDFEKCIFFCTIANDIESTVVFNMIYPHHLRTINQIKIISFLLKGHPTNPPYNCDCVCAQCNALHVVPPNGSQIIVSHLARFLRFRFVGTESKECDYKYENNMCTETETHTHSDQNHKQHLKLNMKHWGTTKWPAMR